MTRRRDPRPARSAPAAVRRAAWRLSIAGLVGTAAVVVVGFALERVRLGSSDASALGRVERRVRAEFAAKAASLRALASALTADRDRIAAALDDPAAARALFDAIEAALERFSTGNLAITAYASTGVPTAWGGRPSELPQDRIAGPPAVFLAPGPLGPRLVHVEPVLAAADGRRIGAIASEMVLVETLGGRVSGDPLIIDSSLVPVSVRARYEGAGAAPGRFAFVINAPSGEPLLEAQVSADDLRQARRNWRRGVVTIALAVLALAILLFAGALLEWRDRSRSDRDWALASAGAAGSVLVARVLLWWAVPPGWLALPLFSPDAYRSARFGPFLGSPVDFLLTGLTLLALVALAANMVERIRVARRRTRRPFDAERATLAAFVAAQLAAGSVSALLVLGHQRLVRDTLASTTIDILHFSLHPWNDAVRLALSFGLLCFHAAAVWGAVLALRLAGTSWTLRRGARAAVWPAALWALPLAILLLASRATAQPMPVVPSALVVAACMMLALLARRAIPRYRHASQAARLIAGLMVLLVVPAFLTYPTVLHFADRAKRRVIEAQFAPHVANQREDLQLRLRRSLDQIDRIESLPDLVAAAVPAATPTIPTDSAFVVWSQTELAAFRETSAVELYAADGSLVSRFALNLPEYTPTTQKWTESSCGWDLFEEVAPFGSEERRVLHAGRGLCRSTPAGSPAPLAAGTLGAIVVHVMLDYNTLPFISSQSPYFELLRTSEPVQREGVTGRDVEFVAYGWGRTSIYTSGDFAWSLEEPLFERIYASRQPFWTMMSRGARRYAVYWLNDRAGMYALGYPTITALGHLVNLAELATLGVVLYVLILAGGMLFGLLAGQRPASGRALFREVRASFYRKLFLAFVAGAVVPVLILAFVARAFIAAQLRAGIESAAAKTATVAERVIEEYATLQQRGSGNLPVLNDDIMVWISRVIDQDVNIFDGPQLLATSERDLFASGLLPTRTPADVFRAITLERLSSFIGEETVRDFGYMVAAAPVGAGDRDAILTVPLTLRQREIERDIDELDRRVLLAALVFILLGAGLGYSMAERIADPVNRLTRATRRIARGDLDARIAATSSDELRRLVNDFNRMAGELRQQRAQLERTHRLEAWADMARQVAHEIKNPLTPIQLSAEHLRRVHLDRGEPLSPVLEECLATIMSQVRLLRQIAAEFSSFASSPTPRPAPTALPELVAEVVDPYRAGLAGRIDLTVDLDPQLPTLELDKTLLARALTNIIENALHAMPARGSLGISAERSADGQRVRISVADTGVGMDRDALERLFEPYFSTKATGTGLGLTIAKRNVELNGGRIEVRSEKGKGTIVTLELPSAVGSPQSAVGTRQ